MAELSPVAYTCYPIANIAWQTATGGRREPKSGAGAVKATARLGRYEHKG